MYSHNYQMHIQNSHSLCRFILMKKDKERFNKAQKQTNNKNTLKERGILMRGNPKLIEALNALLTDELTAINQSDIVHAEM